ncbi:MAG: hypothetical protein PHN90_00400 [Methanothrix sp.]|nr:hypothetical protein [Methanothrix sp.]MDD5769286.1 hypothetical protein [Methanothrix sp.]
MKKMNDAPVVKVRETHGSTFISIPKSIARDLEARYLGVSLEDGRLIYTPVGFVNHKDV